MRKIWNKTLLLLFVHLLFSYSHLASAEPLEISNISFNFYPRPHSETVVLIHGMSTSSKSFLPVLEAFQARYSVLLFDLRGHGQTGDREDSSYSVSEFASDLRVLLDHLAIPRAHLVGHSYGAKIAVDFAYRYPSRVKSLVMEDMGVSPRRRLEGEDALIFSELRGVATSGYRSQEELLANFARFGLDSVFMAKRIRPQADGSSFELNYKPYVTACMGHRFSQTDLSEEFSNLRVPILMLLGSEDQSAVAELEVGQMIQRQHRLNVYRLRGGHNLHRELPSDFIAAVVHHINTAIVQAWQQRFTSERSDSPLPLN